MYFSGAPRERRVDRIFNLSLSTIYVPRGNNRSDTYHEHMLRNGQVASVKMRSSQSQWMLHVVGPVVWFWCGGYVVEGIPRFALDACHVSLA